MDGHYAYSSAYAKPRKYGSLLRRLQRLRWFASGDEVEFTGWSDFSPSLKELYITNECDDQSVELLEGIAAALCKRTDIQLTDWKSFDRVSHHHHAENTLAEYLRCQLNLTWLEIGAVAADGRMSAEAAKLRKLQHLKLDTLFVDHNDLETFCSGLADCPPFLHSLYFLFLMGLRADTLPFSELQPF